MLQESRQNFIDLKKKQVNTFSESTINHFRNVLKPKFFIPKTVDDIKGISDIKIQFCETKEQKSEYLNIILLQSLFDGSNVGCGRNVPMIVSTNDGKLLGVIRMTSSGRLSKPVDELINWSEKIKWKGNTGGIQKLGYAQALVPCQPFGFNCLGGKLLAMLSTSKEVIDYWEIKYKCPMYAVMTLSMTTGVTQYNGLKNYKHIGSTKSNRGVYFCSLYNNSIELLNEKETIPLNDKRLTIQQILDDWKAKAIKRFSNLEKENRIKTEIESYDSLYISPPVNPFFS